MKEKFDNNRICYLGCMIHTIDRASFDIYDTFDQDCVCNYLTQEEIDKLNEANKLINQVLTSTMDRAKTLGINPDY